MINIVIDLGLLAMLLAVALVILRNQSPLSITILTGIYSLALCTLFVVLDAVDVAFTEAAVGAGISTILYLATIRREDERGAVATWPSPLSIALGFGAGLLVIAGTYDMPLYGDPNAPVHQKLAPRFLGQSGDEIGIPNVVTSVLASYRGYDTLGEVVVIFTAGIAVFLLLATTRTAGQGPVRQSFRLLSSPVLKTVLLRVIPLVLLFGLYVQFHGDYGPGGGFQAGVIFGAGLITFGLLTSAAELAQLVRVRWANAGMALGVLTYGGVGIASMIMGGHFLDYTVLAAQQTTGQHIGILIIEFGVGMTVASTMVSLYFSLNRQQG